MPTPDRLACLVTRCEEFCRAVLPVFKNSAPLGQLIATRSRPEARRECRAFYRSQIMRDEWMPPGKDYNDRPLSWLSGGCFDTVATRRRHAPRDARGPMKPRRAAHFDTSVANRRSLSYFGSNTPVPADDLRFRSRGRGRGLGVGHNRRNLSFFRCHFLDCKGRSSW
jgi:hypothetical protein